jgi:N,N'-diacetylchitobiose transport system permease protein
MNRRRLGTASANGAAVLITGLVGFPVYWMLATALKRDQDIQRYSPKFLPFPPYTVNFRKVLASSAFWNAMGSSLTVTLTTVLVGVGLAFLAAIAVARFRFRGRTAFVVALIIVQMIPGEALFIPYYLLLRNLHMLGTMVGLGAVYLSFTLPFAIWMLRGFVQGIPPELEEAALVDGATRWQSFWRILFPLVAPGLISTAVFSFITAWTEFTYAYVLLNDPTAYTLPVFIQSFIGRYSTDYGPQMAVSILFTLPVVAFFLLVQRRATAGLTGGAVKG